MRPRWHLSNIRLTWNRSLRLTLSPNSDFSSVPLIDGNYTIPLKLEPAILGGKQSNLYTAVTSLPLQFLGVNS